jgi:hypothetical protein
MKMAEYASNGKANAALTTGIIGTSLGAIANAGGIMALLGVQPGGNKSTDPGDKPVTRYEMELHKQITERDIRIAALEGNKYTDGKIAEVRAVQAEQAVHNATVGGAVATIKGQVDALLGMTRMVIPNYNVSPGWGPSFVAPGFPPAPPVQTTPPTVSSGSGTATANTGA